MRIGSCLVLISVMFLPLFWVIGVCGDPSYPPIGSTYLVNPSSIVSYDFYCGAFCPTDPNHAMIGGMNKVLRWDGTALVPLDTGVNGNFMSVAWRPDGSYALFVGDTIEKWNGAYLTRVEPAYWQIFPQGPQTFYRDVAWKPDGTYALIVGYQGSPILATVWKYDGSTLVSLYTASNSEFDTVAWRPDGSYALIAGTSGALYKYDGVTFTSISTATSEQLWKMSWKPDGSYALIVGGGPTAGKAWKYDGTSITDISSGLNYYFSDVAWKPSSGWALVPSFNNGLIYNFTGAAFELLYNGSSTLGGVALQRAFWRPDGGLAFVVGEVGTVVKFDGSTFTPLSPTSFVTREILYGSAWKPDGSYALIVGGSQRNGPAGLNIYGKGIILKFDSLTETLTTLSSDLKDLVRGVAWKPDGSYALICGGNGTLIKFDGTSFTTLTSVTSNWLRNVAWKPDGSCALICGYGGMLLKFDGTTTTSISTGITSNLWDVAWKPDGTYALMCGDSGTVLKYDGSSITTLTSGISETLRGVAWKPDGTQAIMVGSSGRMLRFDGSTFTQLSSGTTSSLLDVAWKPDGSYALLAGSSIWLRLWDGSSRWSVPSFTSGELYTVAWKPDGSYALIGGNYGLLLLYGEKVTHFYGVQHAVAYNDDNNLYFVLTGYDGAGKRPGVSAPSFRCYDTLSYAGGLLYGLAGRPQKVDYDTGGWVDHSTGKPLVSAIPAGKWILIFGSPSVHNCAYYYTTVSGESPAYGQVVMDGGKQYYRFMSRSGRTLHSQEMSKVGDHEDSAILMMFKDSDGRLVVIIYGAGDDVRALGSWAAALYFKERIWLTDNGAFDEGTYIVHWVDLNMDGLPQLEEIFLIPTEA